MALTSVPIYAEHSTRRLRQVVGDLLALVWVLVAAGLARRAYDAVLTLCAPGERMQRTGGELSGTFGDAAGVAGRAPIVGDELAGALGRGTRAGQDLSGAGTELIEAVTATATVAAAAVVALALVPVLFWYVPRRVRWIRTARHLAAARRTDPDLLALRALVTAPPGRLLAVAPDPTQAWRDGDVEVRAGLAKLYLAEHGLRP